MGHVGDGGTGQVVRRVGDQVHPDVVLDLGDGAAQRFHDGDRLAPAAAGRGAGQDDEAFRLTAHAGGQVIQPEQLRQRVRVLRAALHLIKHAKLPLDQGLVAPGQAAEHVADALAELGLLDGGLNRGALHRGECLGGIGDLTGLGAQVRRGRLGRHVDVITGAQPAHHTGQPLAGQGAGRAAQPGQLAGHPVAEPQQQEGREDDHEQADAANGGQAPEDDSTLVVVIRRDAQAAGLLGRQQRPGRGKGPADRLLQPGRGDREPDRCPVGAIGEDLFLKSHHRLDLR